MNIFSTSDSTDDYLTPPMDPPTSENEDILNSTGSFSENAWDNYQVRMFIMLYSVKNT